MSSEGFSRPRPAAERIPEADIEKTPEAPPALSYTRELLHARFEMGPEEDRMAYHAVPHTEGVVRRALRISEALELSPQDLKLSEVAAAFHDTVQTWQEDSREGGVIIRKRVAVLNESRSADEAVAWMQQYPDTFTEADCEIVRHAIEATVPGWDPANNTVKQPNLTSEAHPVVRAVALADLSSSGMEPETFRNEGMQLFAEENLDIMRAIRTAKSVDDIDEGLQQAYLARYRGWLKFQVVFVEGRRNRLETELAGLTPEQAEHVRALYSGFDESIAIAKQNAEAAERASFEEVARTLVPGAFAAYV
jgi:hypothetical protein